jgi:7-carboxy-7-deazaguanine synthase
MTYSVKEMFYTLQGEGFHTGRPAVFCRFTGCNLWSGREQDRAESVCQFCDTDFVGTDGQNGGKFKHPADLAQAIAAQWPSARGHRFVVFTGGEPALQLDDRLIAEMHRLDFVCAVETNGTLALPDAVDWVCISPKGVAQVALTHCNELKLVYPQVDAPPERFVELQADYRYLSPINDYREQTIVPARNHATRACIDYCLSHPEWHLTLQAHKIVNID